MAPDFNATIEKPAVDERHRVEHPGTWLRLPCCDGSIHPVKIIDQSDGRIEISIPTEPHPESIKMPAESQTVTLGWTDAGGTLMLNCVAVAPTRPGTWALKVISTSDFMQRRRHIRVSTDATVKLMDGRMDRIIEGSVVDISESGMKVSFANFIPEPSEAPMQFALALDDTVLVVLAKLQWAGRSNPIEWEAGFEFVSVADSLLSLLRAHVMKQLDTRGAID